MKRSNEEVLLRQVIKEGLIDWLRGKTRPAPVDGDSEKVPHKGWETLVTSPEGKEYAVSTKCFPYAKIRKGPHRGKQSWAWETLVFLGWDKPFRREEVVGSRVGTIDDHMNSPAAAFKEGSDLNRQAERLHKAYVRRAKRGVYDDQTPVIDEGAHNWEDEDAVAAEEEARLTAQEKKDEEENGYKKEDVVVKGPYEFVVRTRLLQFGSNIPGGRSRQPGDPPVYARTVRVKKDGRSKSVDDLDLVFYEKSEANEHHNDAVEGIRAGKIIVSEDGLEDLQVGDKRVELPQF